MKLNRIMITMAAAAMVAMSSFAFADTITVQDANQSPDSQPQASSGIYTYTVTLDSQADVQTDDGFVIYDFAGETSFTLTGGLTASEFTLEKPNLGTQDMNNGASAAAELTLVLGGTDNPAVENLVFVYNGTTDITGATTATLTIHTSLTSSPVTGYSVAVDHSGSTDFGISGEDVLVPASVPVPAAFAGGMLLAGLLGFSQLRKARNRWVVG